jgi:hypothetical protein
LQWKFRQLYSFALNKNISLKAFRSRDILDQFWTPLSQEASSQLQELQFLLQQIQANPSEAHKWSYIWNNDEFNSRKAYLKIIVINNASPIFKWMWKYCWGGHIFFLWLLLHDLVNTRELLKRKNMELPDYNCVMCNINSEKSLLHLFFQYSFYIVFMGGRSMNRSLHLGMITTTSFHSPPDKAPNFRTTKRSSKTVTPNPYSSYQQGTTIYSVTTDIKIKHS